MAIFLNLPSAASQAIDLVVNQDEGGWKFSGANTGDTNEWTYGGITKNTWTNFVSKNPSLGFGQLPTSPTQGIILYYNNFWYSLFKDYIAPIPGTQAALLSFAINVGAGTFVKYIQEMYNLPQDAIIGPNTLKAIQSLCENNGSMKKLIKIWRDHYIRITVNNTLQWQKYLQDSLHSMKPTEGQFILNLQGWMNRVDRYVV